VRGGWETYLSNHNNTVSTSLNRSEEMAPRKWCPDVAVLACENWQEMKIQPQPCRVVTSVDYSTG
jgi:hypothetical protein